MSTLVEFNELSWIATECLRGLLTSKLRIEQLKLQEIDSWNSINFNKKLEYNLVSITISELETQLEELKLLKQPIHIQDLWVTKQS